MKAKINLLSKKTIVMILCTVMMIISTVAADSVIDRNEKNYEAQAKDKITLDFYLLPSKDIQSNDKKIVDLAQSIVKEKTKEYDKAKAIYDWVTTNVWQEFGWWETRHESMDALRVLGRRRAMCINFSNLTVAIFRAANIPAKVIYLEDGKTYRHTFCEAFIDGNWLVMNPYFGSNNVYKDRKFGAVKANNSIFFDLTIQNMWDLRNYFGRHIIDFANYLEESYFNGDTRIENIILPDEFTSIGKAAFSGCTNLKKIYIPNNVKSISDNAFSNCPNVTIHGEAGSYAETYAKNNNLKFSRGEF